MLQKVPSALGSPRRHDGPSTRSCCPEEGELQRQAWQGATSRTDREENPGRTPHGGGNTREEGAERLREGNIVVPTPSTWQVGARRQVRTDTHTPLT